MIIILRPQVAGIGFVRGQISRSCKDKAIGEPRNGNFGPKMAIESSLEAPGGAQVLPVSYFFALHTLWCVDVIPYERKTVKVECAFYSIDNE